jgi:predicted DNA-binding transcriptional regulator AlpA
MSSGAISRRSFYGTAPGPEMPGYRAMTISGAKTLMHALSQRGASLATMDEVARELGVSRRTLYRWRHATFHDVEVDGWRATFVIRPDQMPSPVQITPWMRIVDEGES